MLLFVVIMKKIFDIKRCKNEILMKNTVFIALMSFVLISVVAKNRIKYVSSKDLAPKLKKIKLPPNATKKQTEKYIDEILVVSKTQNAFSNDDIQAGMLGKVDHKYLPSLINRMTNNNSLWNFHISLAIVSLVKETDKKLILKMLYYHPKLIDAVVKFGWEEDVRNIIFDKIKVSNSLPVNWIICAGQLAKPENYDTLTGFFIRTYNRGYMYNAIKDLPGIELNNAVAEIWRTNKDTGWSKKQCALIAADFGYLEALEAVIELRNDRNRYFHRIAYDKMYSLTGQRASYAGLKKWFAANKDKLVFDKKAKRYNIKGRGNSKKLTKPAQYFPQVLKQQVSSKDLARELKEIKLPANANKKQTEEYINGILVISKKQNYFTSSDIQIFMLKKIDHKYLTILIKRMDNLNDGRLFHLRAAISSLVKLSDKKMILEKLSKSPGLIHVIMKFNWSKDAKKIIFKKLEDPNNYLHPNWMACAAKVAIPADYEILINYFIENNNKQDLYNIIKKLPGIKLDRAVETTWRASEWGSQDDRKQCALIASEYGYVNALETLVKMLNDSTWEVLASRKFTLLTGKTGSKKQIKKWFNANKNKLVFDKKTRHYVINYKK